MPESPQAIDANLLLYAHHRIFPPTPAGSCVVRTMDDRCEARWTALVLCARLHAHLGERPRLHGSGSYPARVGNRRVLAGPTERRVCARWSLDPNVVDLDTVTTALNHSDRTSGCW